MNMFSSLIRLPLDPMSIEIFEDAVEVLGSLGEPVPLLGIVFQEIFVLVLCGVLERVNPSPKGSAFRKRGLRGKNLFERFEVFVEVYY
jgi:hypothetical protein